MSIRKFVFALALGAATLMPVVASADTPAKGCILMEHRVTAVTPYRIVRQHGRSATQELAGAQVLVQAEPGLTAEWLQLTIQRHLATMQTEHMGDCPLDMRGVRVQVDSAGAGFAVKIIAKDPGQAKEVLRRAELLQG
jgi:hypothetical protein